MTKRCKTLLIILTITLLINNVFTSCCLAYLNDTQTVDGIYDTLQEIVPQNIENQIDISDDFSQESKEYINGGKNVISNTIKVISELEKVDYNIDSLDEDMKYILYNEITYDKYENYIGTYKDSILLALEDLKGQDAQLAQEYLTKMKEAFKLVYSDYTNAYYNVGPEEPNEYGFIEVPDEAIKATTEIENATNEAVNNSGFNPQQEEINTDQGIDILDGVLGIITYPAKLLVLLAGLLAQTIMSIIASTGTPNGGIWLTIDNILFNQLALTDINIFSDSIFLIGVGGQYEQEVLSTTNVLLNIRISIAEWYYAFRNLAIAVALLMLIYIGIRMAISNIAEQKSKYKAMLTNWFVGFGLIFVLHFIIIIVIRINNAIIEILAKTNLTNNQDAYQNVMNQLFSQSWSPSFTFGWASAIVWVILIVLTFIMLIMFIKRFITVSFLALIAPLITITYAMDKAGDNKSQILNTWLKEFCYNVFVQVIYALSYLIFAKIGIDLMVTKLDFGSLTLAILSILAMFLGVNILKQILGFNKASNLVKQLGMGVVIGKTVSTAKKGFKSGKEAMKNNNKQQNIDTSTMPMFTPSGKDRETFINDIKNEKQKETLEHNQSKGNGGYNRKTKTNSKFKRKVNNTFELLTGNLTKSLGTDNIKISRKDKIKIDAQDILNGILKDYVISTNAEMTSNEFLNKVKKLEQKPFNKLTKSEVLLKAWLDKTKSTEGAQQVQKMIANFKDNYFKE